MNNYSVLIIDDEVQIRRMLEITLSNNNYKVHLATTAKEGIVMAANFLPDIILLDLGLPDENGHDVLLKLREWFNKPIVILSVQSSEEDIVKALDNGANDYLVKPFRTGELLARLRSVLRTSNFEIDSPILTCGDLQIDFNNRLLTKNEQAIKVTSTEYAFLS